MKDPKDTAKTDKRGKRKVTKAFTEIEKEELGVLRSVAAATQEQTNRDISDLLGKYMATKMRKLSQMLDEDATEAAEYNKATVLMKARKKAGPVQTWSNYYKLENLPV